MADPLQAPVLVLGRSGQVAAALQRLAAACLPGRPLLALGRPELDLAASDLAAVLARLCDQVRPALVINAAAYTAVDRAESEQPLALAINGHAVGVLARVCAAAALPLFHLSSDYVFDGSGERPWAPGDRPLPLGVYGTSKLLGEQLLQEAVRDHGLRALVLRVSWVFGQQGANFVRTMLRLAAEREVLKVVADQVGGPTSAESIARALLQLVEPAIANRQPLGAAAGAFPWGIHHFQGQPLVSWHGFAAEIVGQAMTLQLLERPPVVMPISTAEFPTPARRPANARLDCSSAVAQLGLELPAWREDLRQFLLAAAMPPVRP